MLPAEGIVKLLQLALSLQFWIKLLVFLSTISLCTVILWIWFFCIVFCY